MNGKGNIFEVTGLQGSTPAMERHRGLMDALAGIPNIKRVGSVDGGWLQSQAGEKVDSVLRVHKDIDLLFAQNDRMAIGAYLAARQQGREKEMLFVGVDALPGKDYGLELFAFLELDAYNTGLYVTPVQEVSRKEQYLQEIEDTALWYRQISLSTEDRLVVMSTCTENITNGRHILIGKLSKQTYKDTYKKTLKRNSQIDRIDWGIF